MLAQSRHALLLDLIVGQALDPVVIAGSVTYLALNPDGRRRVRRGKFYRHLISGIQFSSGEHSHAAITQGERPAGHNRGFSHVPNYYPDWNVDFVSPPAAGVRPGFGLVGECVSQGIAYSSIGGTGSGL
jgi:hypothetical protein